MEKADAAKIQEPFTHRSNKAILIAAIIIVLFLLLWRGIIVLLLLFGGTLLAILLNGLANWLGERSFLSYKWALTAVIVGLLLVITVGGTLLTPSLIEQARQLGESLPQSAQTAVDQYTPFTWNEIQQQIPSLSEITFSQPANLLPSLRGLVSTTLNALTNIFIILFVGVYLAVNPGLYLEGVIKLAPLEKRSRFRQVLNQIGHTLRWWLIGRLISMTVIGALSVIGLMLIGVPLAFILGILSGLLAFVPYIGPLIAIVPPLLLGLTTGLSQALYVLLLYAGIQFIESYFLTPLVQQRIVLLPPVVLLLSQVLLGILLGVFGLIIANPLTTAVLVMIKMLYVEDTLGDPDVQLLN